MKLNYLFVFLFVLFTSTLFGQKDSTYSYLKGESVISYERLNKVDTSNIMELNIWLVKGKKDTLERDYKLKVDLKKITATSKDIHLLTNYVFFSKEEMKGSDSLVGIIRIQVNGDTTDVEKYFSVKISNPGESLNEFNHEKLIVLKLKIPELTVAKKREIAMGKIDSLEVGQLIITNFEEIAVYEKTKSENRKTLKKSFIDENKGKKVTRRDRHFGEHYKASETIGIELVHISINEGRICTMVVDIKDKKGYYINKGPITLTNYYNRRFYRLQYSGSEPELEGTFIILKDFMNYIPSKDRTYFPSKSDFTLPKNDTIVTEKLNLIGSPNTFFDARLYTDVKGLAGDENGIAQTEINAQFIGNSSNVGRSHATFFQFVNIGLSLAKFDSKFDTLRMTSFNNREGADLLKLTQRANASFRVDADIIRYSRVHDAYLTLGHQIYSTKVQASLTDSTSATKSVFTPTIYLILGGSLHASEWIRADFKFPVKLAYSYDQPFINYDRKWEFLLAPEIEIAVNIQKVDKADPEKKRAFAFGRIRYYDMPQFKGNNYWQIQAGVEIPISSLFK